MQNDSHIVQVDMSGTNNDNVVDYEEVYWRIKEIMASQHLTATQVAQDCDFSKNIFVRIKTGDNRSIDTYVTLARYLGVSIDYLVGLSQQKT